MDRAAPDLLSENLLSHVFQEFLWIIFPGISLVIHLVISQEIFPGN